MILAFSDDQTVTVFDTVGQANVDCEGIDVENGVYTFMDERGYLLRPTFSEPNRKTFLGLVLVSSSLFQLEPTQDRDSHLRQDVLQDRISVDKGPTSICTNEQLKGVLRRADPELRTVD